MTERGRLLPGIDASGHEVAPPVTRVKGDVAFRCALARHCPKTSVRIGRQSTLHHAFLGYLAIYATTNRRPLGLLSPSWTRPMPPAYAARETRPLAPDHSGGSASDVSLGLPSGCRA